MRGPLLALGVALGLAALVELGARAALALRTEPVSTRFAASDVWQHGEKAFHEPDAELGWRAVAGFEGPNVRINALGMRGPEPRADAARGVLLLGDSSTFGYAMPEDATFARRLAVGLQDAGVPGVDVLNGGVIGYSSDQGKRWFAELADEITPDDVVVWFGYNDHHSARLSDAEKRAPSAATAGWLARSGVLQLARALRGDPELRTEPVPRVDVATFRENMLTIAERAAALGARPLFLTVPLRPNVPLVENFARLERRTSHATGDTTEVLWMRQIDVAAALFGPEVRGALVEHFLGAGGSQKVEWLAAPRAAGLAAALARDSPDLAIGHYLHARALAIAGKDASVADRRWRELDGERVALEAYNDVLRTLASEGSIELLDLARAFAESADPADLFHDVVHPSPLGHAFVARLLVERLRER